MTKRPPGRFAYCQDANEVLSWRSYLHLHMSTKSDELQKSSFIVNRPCQRCGSTRRRAADILLNCLV